ncbi:MAG: beta-galactosidase, partial [Cellulosilyticaceae bacterium]
DLKVVIDDKELLNTEVDTTRVCCTFVDQIGNILPYYNGIIQIEVEGDIEVIGPKTVAVIGGSIAFWIKTKANLQAGRAKITVKSLNTMIVDKVLDINIK